jgi:hypothetical protein
MSKQNKQKGIKATDVLTIESVRQAVKLLKKNQNVPFVTHISSSLDWYELIKYDPSIRGFSFYGGIPCYLDKDIPHEIARIHYSDGKTKDIKITNKRFLKPPSAVKN